MSAALDLYAKLTETSDDKERARLIADAFEALEARFPHLNDLATQGHVRESELRLQKEIKEVEGRLQKDIKEVEARLQRDIKDVELQIKQVEVNLHKAMAAQTRWLLGVPRRPRRRLQARGPAHRPLIFSPDLQALTRSPT